MRDESERDAQPTERRAPSTPRGDERAPAPHTTADPHPPRTDDEIDDSIEATFPASDPPARSTSPTV
jgi:hypothetical protein